MGDTRKAIVMAILCCAAHTGLAHSAAPLPAIEDVDLSLLTGDGWYRASLMGAPVGYVHSTASVEDGEAGPTLRAVETMSIKIDFGQGAFEVRATTTTEYGEDLKPRRIRSEQNEFGRLKVIEATVSGQELHIKTKAGDVTSEKTLSLGPRFGSELTLSLAAVQGLLPDDGEYTFQTFVPELEMLVDFDVACRGREVVRVNGEDLEALKIDLSAREIPLKLQWWMDDGGNLVKQAMPTLMNLIIEKVTEQEALVVITPFMIADHIAVATRMGSARSLKYVRLKAGSPGEPAAELVPEMPLQHVAPTGGEREAEITVKAETEEGLQGLSLPFTDPGLEEYLSPTDIVQSDDPAIVAKAREIVGDETDAWKAAKKLITWVYRSMSKVDHDPRPITASECLTLMKGDCSEHATLLCALARAVGIPSKFVTGVVYLDDGYYYHAWNELYIGRWVSCDPTWGEVTANAGHLILASGSLTSRSFAKTNLDAVRCMGVLTLEVLEHRKK